MSRFRASVRIMLLGFTVGLFLRAVQHYFSQKSIQVLFFPNRFHYPTKMATLSECEVVERQDQLSVI